MITSSLCNAFFILFFFAEVSSVVGYHDVNNVKVQSPSMLKLTSVFLLKLCTLAVLVYVSG